MVGGAVSRLHNAPWRRTDNDRGYQRRVERAKARGEYTAPGTQPNARDAGKVARKRSARNLHAALNRMFADRSFLAALAELGDE